MATQEEPNLPPIPSLGEDLKKDQEKFKVTVIACYSCKFQETRPFTVGDYVFKELSGRTCPDCGKEKLYVKEIYEDIRKKDKDARKKTGKGKPRKNEADTTK